MATPAQLAEKARQDRESYPSPIHAPPRSGPPPLPPRENSVQGPPPYSSDDDRRSRLISEQWHSNDPRSSSTHSLVPESRREGRRTLLLVYVHGFMGNETSFQSFPAHVHNLLTITLAETHVVHTKIYPRYKSRKAIDFARDDFSNWLEPHENDRTDIILLGHSMGGILSAEVALQQPYTPATGKPFRHRILGTINFDTPFLGMHPGVVVSGIGSLFRPAPEPPNTKSRQASTSGATSPSIDSYGSASSPSYATSTNTISTSQTESETSSQLSLVQSITSPLSTPSPNDPFFNPPFPNDVRLPERKGWTNILHFINKHSDGLTAATKQYFMSHIEFGGCLADYPGLKNRYEKLRSLEDVDEHTNREGPGYRAPIRRIRFVNYYTASTGRPKAPKPPPAGQMIDKDGNLQPIEVEMQDMNLHEGENASLSSTPRPSISVEEHRDGVITPQPLEDVDSSFTSPIEAQIHNLGPNSGVDTQEDDFDEPPAMRHIDSMPIPDDEESFPEPATTPDPTPPNAITSIPSPSLDLPPPTQPSPTTQTPSETLSLNLTPAPTFPPLPPLPIPPTPLDLTLYTDKDSRKLAEKEHKRLQKTYNQAIKDRDSAINDRAKIREKWEKRMRVEREKAVREEEKIRVREEKEKEKLGSNAENAETISNRKVEHQPSQGDGHEDQERKESTKPKRDKKFCMLPPEKGGVRDKCWVRIYMEGVDEVGAHCGLFFMGGQYEGLVGDVGERIGGWVGESESEG